MSWYKIYIGSVNSYHPSSLAEDPVHKYLFKRFSNIKSNNSKIRLGYVLTTDRFDRFDPKMNMSVVSTFKGRFYKKLKIFPRFRIQHHVWDEVSLVTSYQYSKIKPLKS